MSLLGVDRSRLIEFIILSIKKTSRRRPMLYVIIADYSPTQLHLVFYIEQF
jgi:hypothetical protein